MRTIKLDEHLFESLLDLIGNDFNREYDSNIEKSEAGKTDELDTSFMKDDLALFEACIKDFDFSNETVAHNYQVIAARWKDRIKEVESL